METKTSKTGIPQEELRLRLQNELVERCRKNPKYSLRAFAKQLDLAPSVVSSILNGKRTITAATVLRISNVLGLSEQDRSHYLKNSKKRKSTFRQVQFDRFLVISEWYHFAILELLKIEGFEFSPAGIATALGISVNQANFALQRLERTGFLERNEQGGFQDAFGGNAGYIQGDRDHRALRDLQINFLQLAIERLRDTAPEERDNTALTMAIRRERLPEAKRKLKEFRRAFAADLESGAGKDSVYQLVLGFFPLTKTTRSKQ
jgi:transcriptional regulator with XRE-family HTH domain